VTPTARCCRGQAFGAVPGQSLAPVAVGVAAMVVECAVAVAWEVEDVGGIAVVGVEVGDGEHEVVDGFGGGNGVECDDAGGGDLVDVAGLGAFVVGLHLDGQFGGVDQVVTPEASVPGGEEAGDGVDAADGAVLGEGDFDSGLGAGDEVALDGGVDPVAGGVGVGGEEDPVGLLEVAEDGGPFDAGLVERQLDVGVGAAGVAGGDFGLGLVYVVGFSRDEPGQVGDVDGLAVDEDEVSDAGAGEELDEDAANASEPDDGHGHQGQGALALVAEEASLAVVGVVDVDRGGCESRAEASEVVAGDDEFGESGAGAVGQPEVTCCGVGSDDEAADSGAADLGQGGVAAFVAGHVVGREPDVVPAEVVVYGDVDVVVRPSREDVVADERGGQGTVAVLARDVVDAVHRGDQPAGE